MTPNRRLKEVREKLNFTQAQLGVAADIHQVDISRMEKKAKITDKLIRYLYKQDVNLNWLLTGEGDMFMPNRRFTTGADEKKVGKESEIEYHMRTKEPPSIEFLKQFVNAYENEMKTLKRDLEKVKKIVLEAKGKNKI